MSNTETRAFCDEYKIAMTQVYEEIKAGRLPIAKVDWRTLIGKADAARWSEARKNAA